MKVAAVALLALLPSIAYADVEPDTRDPGTATTLSIVGTVGATVALIPTMSMKNEDWKKGLPLLGLAEILPSAGQVYAGNYVSAGLVTRLVGGTLIVIALKDPFEDDQIVSSNSRMLGISGCLLTLAGTVYDIATAGRAAERYNARGVRVTPAITTEHGLTPGFSLAGEL